MEPRHVFPKVISCVTLKMAAFDCDISVVKKGCSKLGEGPHWDETTQRLVWVDIFGQSVHLLDPVTGKVRPGSDAVKVRMSSSRIKLDLNRPKYSSIFFGVYDYVGTVELSIGHWNPKRKLEVAVHFFRI